MNVEKHKDFITEVQAAYADAWAEAIVKRRDADMRRRCEQHLGYYIHDGVRRILAELGIEDPILLRKATRERKKKLAKYLEDAFND